MRGEKNETVGKLVRDRDSISLMKVAHAIVDGGQKLQPSTKRSAGPTTQSKQGTPGITQEPAQEYKSIHVTPHSVRERMQQRMVSLSQNSNAGRGNKISPISSRNSSHSGVAMYVQQRGSRIVPMSGLRPQSSVFRASVPTQGLQQGVNAKLQIQSSIRQPVSYTRSVQSQGKRIHNNDVSSQRTGQWY